jgi:hypothetical protein
MLKSHLRSWLTLSEEARVYRIACTGIEMLQEELQAARSRGHTELELADTVQVINKLESYRREVLGELPKGAQEKDIMAAFYDWVVVTAASLQMPQKHFLEVISRGVRQKKIVEVADLDLKIFKTEVLTRYLNLERN